MLAFLGFLTLEEGHHNGDGAVAGHGYLHLLQGRAHGGQMGRAGNGVKIAAGGLGYQVVALVVPVGAFLPEVGDGNQEQAGVGRLERGVPNSELVQIARRVALDDHVDVGR